MNRTVNETEFVFEKEMKEFTMIPNSILKDTRISFKALGIYTQILQFRNSPKHRVYLQGLMKNKTDGRDSISSGMQELIEYGYVKCEPLRESGKYKGLKYIVYMNPSVEDSKHFYEEYLLTGHWKQVRAEALERAGGKCQLCSSQYKLNVHHNNYKHLWKETEKDVTVLCRTCHSIFHNREV